MAGALLAAVPTFKVGDLVSGPFGQGQVEYIVPSTCENASNRGKIEVGGSGGHKLFHPTVLTLALP